MSFPIPNAEARGKTGMLIAEVHLDMSATIYSKDRTSHTRESSRLKGEESAILLGGQMAA